MTNVITNVKDIMEKTDVKVQYSNPKIDVILNFLKYKQMAKKSRNEIEKYTERNKNVRNGETVLTGTRITTKELTLIVDEALEADDEINYIMKEYPSIDCEEKVVYGLLYEIKKTNTILFILGTMLWK